MTPRSNGIVLVKDTPEYKSKQKTSGKNRHKKRSSHMKDGKKKPNSHQNHQLTPQPRPVKAVRSSDNIKGIDKHNAGKTPSGANRPEMIKVKGIRSNDQLKKAEWPPRPIQPSDLMLDIPEDEPPPKPKVILPRILASSDPLKPTEVVTTKKSLEAPCEPPKVKETVAPRVLPSEPPKEAATTKKSVAVVTTEMPKAKEFVKSQEFVNSKRSLALEIPRPSLQLNVDEILRVGATMERFQMSLQRKEAFDWLSQHRTILDKDQRTSAFLTTALSDVEVDKFLAINAMKELQKAATLTTEETEHLIKTIEVLRPPVTVGQVANLLHTSANFYRKRN